VGGLWTRSKVFKPLPRAFLQLLSQPDSYDVAQKHEAHGVATGSCRRDGLRRYHVAAAMLPLTSGALEMPVLDMRLGTLTCDH